MKEEHQGEERTGSLNNKVPSSLLEDDDLADDDDLETFPLVRTSTPSSYEEKDDDDNNGNYLKIPWSSNSASSKRRRWALGAFLVLVFMGIWITCGSASTKELEEPKDLDGVVQKENKSPESGNKVPFSIPESSVSNPLPSPVSEGSAPGVSLPASAAVPVVTSENESVPKNDQENPPHSKDEEEDVTVIKEPDLTAPVGDTSVPADDNSLIGQDGLEDEEKAIGLTTDNPDSSETKSGDTTGVASGVEQASQDGLQHLDKDEKEFSSVSEETAVLSEDSQGNQETEAVSTPEEHGATTAEATTSDSITSSENSQNHDGSQQDKEMDATSAPEEPSAIGTVPVSAPEEQGVTTAEAITSDSITSSESSQNQDGSHQDKETDATSAPEEPSAIGTIPAAVIETAEPSGQQDKEHEEEEDITFEAAVRALVEKEGFRVNVPVKPPGDNLCFYTNQVLNATKDDPIILVNESASMKCGNLFGSTGGTGNSMQSIFATRLTALAQRRTALLMSCTYRERDEEAKYIFPWIQGYFPAMEASTRDPTLLNMVPIPECSRRRRSLEVDQQQQPSPQNLRGVAQIQQEYEEGESQEPYFSFFWDQRLLNSAINLRYYIPFVAYDLRRMAIALTGVHPDPDHPSHEFERKYLQQEAALPKYSPVPATGHIPRVSIHDYYKHGPLFPDVTHNDVVIHYRCGDLLTGGYGKMFYYVRFEEYAKLISPEARSIGIVTQPFEPESGENGLQSRSRDKIDVTGPRCKRLVTGLIDYLKQDFPNAVYNIHNGPNETVALAHARMVMANQTLAIFSSSFSQFPVVATFGAGYYPLFNWNVLKDEVYPDAVTLIDYAGKGLYVGTLQRLLNAGKDDIVLQYLRHDIETIEEGEG